MWDIEPLIAISDTVWQAVLAAGATVVVGYMQYLTRAVREVRREIKVVHKNTNSLVEQLVITTREEAHARGEQDERNRHKSH